MCQEVDDEMMPIRNGLTDFVVADDWMLKLRLSSGRPYIDRQRNRRFKVAQETKFSFIDGETNDSPQLE